jgi:hypothetical protein
LLNRERIALRLIADLAVENPDFSISSSSGLALGGSPDATEFHRTQVSTVNALFRGCDYFEIRTGNDYGAKRWGEGLRDGVIRSIAESVAFGHLHSRAYKDCRCIDWLL